MGMMKSLIISDGRYRPRAGIDFTDIETSSMTTVGTVMKFRGGALLGYNGTAGEWTKGLKLTVVFDEGTYTTEYKGKYSKGFAIEVTTTSEQDGHSHGALNVDFERAADYGHDGGSPDCGIRGTTTNYATCTSGGARGMDVMAYGRGNQAHVHGALITARSRGSSCQGTGQMYGARIVCKNGAGVGGWASAHGLEVACESDGVHPTENSILFIEKQSNSYTAHTKAGLEICNNSHTTYNMDITYGIYMKSGVDGCNITYAFGFDSNDGDDGFTATSGASQGGNIDGYITLYDVETGQALYIGCYDAAPA